MPECAYGDGWSRPSPRTWGRTEPLNPGALHKVPRRAAGRGALDPGLPSGARKFYILARLGAGAHRNGSPRLTRGATTKKQQRSFAARADHPHVSHQHAASAAASAARPLRGVVKSSHGGRILSRVRTRDLGNKPSPLRPLGQIDYLYRRQVLSVQHRRSRRPSWPRRTASCVHPAREHHKLDSMNFVLLLPAGERRQIDYLYPATSPGRTLEGVQRHRSRRPSWARRTSPCVRPAREHHKLDSMNFVLRLPAGERRRSRRPSWSRRTSSCVRPAREHHKRDSMNLVLPLPAGKLVTMHFARRSSGTGTPQARLDELRPAAACRGAPSESSRSRRPSWSRRTSSAFNLHTFRSGTGSAPLRRIAQRACWCSDRVRAQPPPSTCRATNAPAGVPIGHGRSPPLRWIAHTADRIYFRFFFGSTVIRALPVLLRIYGHQRTISKRVPTIAARVRPRSARAARGIWGGRVFALDPPLTHRARAFLPVR